MWHGRPVAKSVSDEVWQRVELIGAAALRRQARAERDDPPTSPGTPAPHDDARTSRHDTRASSAHS